MMKSLNTFILIFCCLSLCAQQAKGPIISFEAPYRDFESLVEGKVVEHVFEFANNGDKDIIINNVLTSCGCTASDWSNIPIKPGDKGVIKVTFDSNGKIGQQRKVITILSNAINKRTELIIEAFVLPKRSQF